MNNALLKCRKERNREAARLSRKRKKDYQMELQTAINDKNNLLDQERNNLLNIMHMNYFDHIHQLALLFPHNVY